MKRNTSKTTRSKIIRAVRSIIARDGAEGVSMRTLGRRIGITQSVLYYYFPDKDQLLRAMFDETNILLGKKRRALPALRSFPRLLEQRIGFQFDQGEAVTAVLKYYLHARRTFPHRKEGGYVPEKAALHIEEVLAIGKKNGVLLPVIDIAENSKVIAHAINGFVMEYYPLAPKGTERTRLIRSIAGLIYPALTGKRFPDPARKKGGDQI
jgi:AcrR family transcriptional regulator